MALDVTVTSEAYNMTPSGLQSVTIVNNKPVIDTVTLTKNGLALPNATATLTLMAERMLLGNFIHLLPLYVLSGVLFYWISMNIASSLHKLKKEEFLSYIPSRFCFRRIYEFIPCKCLLE